MIPKRIVLIFCLLASGAMPSLTQAQNQATTNSALTTEASRMDQLAASQGGSKVIDKLSGDFSSFLGADSKTVVTGLRNGTPFTLTTIEPGPVPGAPPVVTNTTITPPTGKMGFGNVFISLALAKEQLSQVGITQPTPTELQAALTGGSITTGPGTTTNLQGILTMRSQDMGWGQIAQKLGVKLGAVVSGMKSANHSMAAQTGGSSANSVVSASGKSVGNSNRGLDGKGELGRGIVSGSGRSAGPATGITTGRGQGHVPPRASGRGDGFGGTGQGHGPK